MLRGWENFLIKLLTHACGGTRFNINSIMLMLRYSKAPGEGCQRTSKWLSRKQQETKAFENFPSSSWIFMLEFLKTLRAPFKRKVLRLGKSIDCFHIIRHDTFRVCLSRWVYGSLQTTLNYKFASMLVSVINIILLHSNYYVECFPDNNLYDSRVM